MVPPAVDQTLRDFARECAKWRLVRGLTKKQLAVAMGFDPSYVSHVERGRHPPTANFASRAEAVLDAGQEIWNRYLRYEAATGQSAGWGAGWVEPPARQPRLPQGSVLVVVREVATLVYAAGRYDCTVRRRLYNAGTEPVTRYPAVVVVDRYPGDVDVSKRYYRDHPLTLDELRFSAVYGDPPGEPMGWEPRADADSYKEIHLLFENESAQFPLYPGREATIAYRYTVTEDKWGPWFEREIRMPTRELVVRLKFPAAAHATVWGTQRTLTGDAPLGSPVRKRAVGGHEIFEWSTREPPLLSWYRLQWRLDDRPAPADPAGRAPASWQNRSYVQRFPEQAVPR
jgi:transcriptional regulator with XRE-family HTH domain